MPVVHTGEAHQSHDYTIWYTETKQIRKKTSVSEETARVIVREGSLGEVKYGEKDLWNR